MRSHLGKMARLTETALHMNSPLIYSSYLLAKIKVEKLKN